MRIGPRRTAEPLSAPNNSHPRTQPAAATAQGPCNVSTGRYSGICGGDHQKEQTGDLPATRDVGWRSNK